MYKHMRYHPKMVEIKSIEADALVFLDNTELVVGDDVASHLQVMSKRVKHNERICLNIIECR